MKTTITSPTLALLMRRWIILGLMIILGLTACNSSNDDDPLPTLANATDIAATLGILPPEAMDATLTANAPSPTTAATETPLPTIPTDTPTITPTLTLTFTPIPTRPFADNPQPNVIVMSAGLPEGPDLWVMQLDSSGLSPLVNSLAGRQFVPTCDPMGNALIFDSDHNGDREIYRVDFETMEPRPITDTVGENYQPIWSPAGDKIAFVSTRAGSADIWVMDPGGGNVQQLTTTLNADEIFPSWSPDGKQIWYSSNRDSNFDIYIYDLATGEENPFTLTPDQNELYPVLSPDMKSVAFMDETTSEVPQTGSVFIADVLSGQRRLIASGEGRIEMPSWADNTSLLVSANLGADGISILEILLNNESSTVLTPAGGQFSWPRLCYIPQQVLSTLLPATIPETEVVLVATATQANSPTVTTFPTSTPPPTTTLTPTSVPTVTEFDSVSNVPSEWLTSSETWIGDEMAFIAPAGLPTDNVRAFLFDNLINLVWDDNQGQHVLTMAIEAYRGALEVTLIGYTINDLPGQISNVDGFDEKVRDQILRHSVRPGVYHLENVEITNVNVTFVFRVPILSVGQSSASRYIPNPSNAAPDWLISTELWTLGELGRVFSLSMGSATTVNFGDNQLQYAWNDADGAHLLMTSLMVTDGDLIITPSSYTINGQSAANNQLEHAINVIREGILFHSFPPGEIQVARVVFGAENMEVVALIPPQFE